MLLGLYMVLFVFGERNFLQVTLFVYNIQTPSDEIISSIRSPFLI